MYSIIMPCEDNRYSLFLETYHKYQDLGLPEDVEFVLVSRTLTNPCLDNVRSVWYSWEGEHFNPAMALNLGVRHARYDNVIITSPEVIPLTNVLEQLKEEKGNNVICQVYDEEQDGSIGMSLVNSKFRSTTPCMYFLALFNKRDIKNINGWDEKFMNCHGYEDDDFGARMVRAGISFKVRDDIQALHQWHQRGNSKEGITNGIKQYQYNNSHNIVKPIKGLEKLK